MERMPLISVVIPVYNVEQYLDMCMETVVGQSYENLQVILVDDGSGDSSGAMCDRWQRTDPRIQVIHKPNGGLSSARNAGLGVVRGEYVTFVDSDDRLHPDACRILLDDLRKNSADIAICDAVHIFPDKETEWHRGTGIRTLTSREAVMEMWYQKSFLPSAWGKLYRASLFRDIRFTENILFEDLDIMHLLFWQAERIVYHNIGLYGYVHRENSITTGKFGMGDLDIIPIAEKMEVFARKQDPVLIPAAQAYSVTAALRVELNAPKEEMYAQGRAWARQTLKQRGPSVRKDPMLRRKARVGLLMYFCCRPLMRLVYKKVNRWK